MEVYQFKSLSDPFALDIFFITAENMYVFMENKYISKFLCNQGLYASQQGHIISKSTIQDLKHPILLHVFTLFRPLVTFSSLNIGFALLFLDNWYILKEKWPYLNLAED